MDTTALLSYLIALIFAFFGVGSDTPSRVTEANATTTAEVLTVTDGDTITVRLASGEEATVRYIGIDTPEPYRDGTPACGARDASTKNESLVEGQTVTLVADVEDTDRFGRLLRYVYIDDVFVNETLIREGYARSLMIQPNTRFAATFADLERVAVANKRGIWSRCTHESS